MGSIDMIKPPLPTVLSSAINKSLQHKDKISLREQFLGTPRIKPEAAGCKARMLSIVLCAPHLCYKTFFLKHLFVSLCDTLMLSVKTKILVEIRALGYFIL